MKSAVVQRTTVFSIAIASLALSGCRAKPANKVEAHVVNWTKHHVTVGGKKDKNPLQATPAVLADGKQLFVSYCMVCHGLDGQNTGVPFAQTLSPAVPSLASEEVQSYSDGQLKWVIKNGIWPSGMPPSSGDFSDEDMWQLVLYIRHLPPKGSLGEPAVYSGK